MSNKSGIADNIINLPEGGGAQKGMGETFSPDLFSGTGNFSFPIAVPPGRNGLQPALTVGYSSGNGNSEWGLGWGLSIPGVMRKTNRGIPVYDDENDTFILSGAEDLVPVQFSKEQVDGVWHFKTQYRPRTEGLFARITHHKTNQGVNYWEVRSKDGLISYYGNPTATNPDDEANTVIAHPERRDHIFGWKLYRTVDVFGNDIVYTYQRDHRETEFHHFDQLYLARVDYTNYDDEGTQRYLCSVQFEYEDRPDPFSTHLPGFEVRTTQRIKHVRTYTHPKDVDRPAGYSSSGETFIDILVKRYDFFFVDERVASGDLGVELAAKNGASVLSQVQVCGFDHQEEPEKMPPLEFRYSGFHPVGKDFTPITGRNLPPVSLAHPEYEVADLNGNGLPDIVQINGQTARYWRNRGDGSFDEPRNMKEAPLGVSLGEAGVSLADADGDGRVDLMVNKGSLAGYFTLNPDGEWDRRSLKKYETTPSFSFADPEVQLMDLNGDGITDVLRNGSRFEMYYHDREHGWQDSQFVNKQKLEDFPNVSFSDPRVRVAGISGGGLQDIVLLQDGNISYWPNQGYGNWGKRVFMRNSPRLPYRYNPARIMLADFDGDGLTDLAYIDDHKVTLWVNQSGNAWSDPIEITGTPRVSDMDAVRAIDMMGTGVPGILWSYNAGAGTREQMYYLDLTGGVKPYLLNEMVNNMGALTRVQYRSSVQDYLRDLKAPAYSSGNPESASPWKTTLPMPVLVVAKTEVHDLIAHSKLVTEYSYHHGYWDGVEREFRGFGRVDQRDTETFNEFNNQSLFHGDNNGWHSPHIPEVSHLLGKEGSGVNRTDQLVHNTVEKVHYTPPMMTRTWFHQGPVEESAVWVGTSSQGCKQTDWTELNNSAEYYPEKWDGVTAQPVTIKRPSEMVNLLKSLPRKARRDAYRTLRGAVLRTELYALDGTRFQHKPYTITEAQYGVRREFDASVFSFNSTGRSGWVGPQHSGYIFFSFSVGQRTTQWERGNDPMTSYAFTDNYDEYGIPLQQVAIAVPRYRQFLSVDSDPPKGYSATLGRTELIHKDTETHYLIGRSKKSSSYEIVNDGTDDLFTLRDKIFSGEATRKLLGQSVNFYDGDPCQAFTGLPYGRIGDYGVPVRSMQLVTTDSIMEDAYGSVPDLAASKNALGSEYPDEFKALLPNGLGYKRESTNVQYLVDKKPQRDPLRNRTVLIDEGGEQRALRGSRCWSFGGSDYVIFNAGIPSVSPDQGASVSLWFRTTSTDYMHLVKGDSNSWIYVLGMTGGRVYSRTADSSHVLGSTFFNDGEWHHMVYNLDIVNRETHIYIDGVHELTHDFGAANKSNVSIYYVGGQNATTQLYTGDVKDIRLFEKELDADEREQVKQFGMLGCEKAHLLCEEEEGSVALNRIGTFYNGEIFASSLSAFHSSESDLGYSFADNLGYTLADGTNHKTGNKGVLDADVVIPAGTSLTHSCALDLSNNPYPLDFMGRAAYNAEVINNSCLNLDPDDNTYLEMSSPVYVQTNKTSYDFWVDWLQYDNTVTGVQTIIGNNGSDNFSVGLYQDDFIVRLGSTSYSTATGLDLSTVGEFTFRARITNMNYGSSTCDVSVYLYDFDGGSELASHTFTSVVTSNFLNDGGAFSVASFGVLFASYQTSPQRKAKGCFTDYRIYIDDELQSHWPLIGSGSLEYDTEGSNHLTLHTDDLTSALSGTQDRYSHKAEYGFTRYTENGGSGIIDVPYGLDGNPLGITTPSGYTKEADYPAGIWLYNHAEYKLNHAVGLATRTRSELDNKAIGAALGENDLFSFLNTLYTAVQISLDGEDLTAQPFDAPGYYIEGSKAKFDFHIEGATIYGNAVAVRDPLDREATVTFDDYDLLPKTVTDPVGMQTEAWYDYRLFTPYKAKDPNDNFSEFAFNRLGLLYKSAAKAKYDPDHGSSNTADRIADDLDHPAAVLEYDFFNFMDNGDPIWVKTTQRQYHYYGPTPEFGDKEDTLVSCAYSDGFGRLLQSRSQAEEVIYGDPVYGDSGLPADQSQNDDCVGIENTNDSIPNVVVNGWKIYNNKGLVVEQYEPYFDQGFDYKTPAEVDAHLATSGRAGQKARMFYDPRGQAIRTLSPDNTESRVVIGTPHDVTNPPVIAGRTLSGAEGSGAEGGSRDNYTPSPWISYAYDANDLGAQYEAPAGGLSALGLIDPNDVSQGYASHFATPKITEIDELGRTIKTTEYQATADAEDVVMQFEYDIRGNVTRIIDAYDRDVFTHKYNLANQTLWTEHIDSGVKTVVYDLMGRPTELRDAKGSHMVNSFDELSRPIRMWAADNSNQSLTLRSLAIFGDDATYGPASPKTTNHLGMPYKSYDEGGMIEISDYHFSGAPLTKKQQVISDSTLLSGFPSGAPYDVVPYTVDWVGLGSLPSILDATVYQTDNSGYDALGRVFKTTLPADVNSNRKELKPQYNKAGALHKVHFDGTEYVKEMAYNAKGQPLLTALGNGIMTRYVYSETNFRLLRTQSEKYTYTSTGTEHQYAYQSGTKKHNTAHQYDLAGNILKILERSTDCGLSGTPDQLDRKFKYDPLNRLLEATGREAQSVSDTVLFGEQTQTGSGGKPSPASMQAYTRKYTYDKMENITQLRQTVGSTFTRNFHYNDANSNILHSIKKADDITNYADFTYDVNGNKLTAGSTRKYLWDYGDQLKAYLNQTGTSEPTTYAHYLYSGGQRVKKLVRTSGGATETTVYIDGVFEHRYDSGANAQSVTQVGGVATVRVGYAFGGVSGTTYNLTNHLGSVSLRLSDTGTDVDMEEYYPFGDSSVRTWAAKRYRYVGKEKDQESGLYYYGARYYSAWTCRFISTDPLAWEYSFYTPYQYAGNKPINFIDLDGLEEANVTNSNSQNKTDDSLKTYLTPAGEPITLPKGAIPTFGSDDENLPISDLFLTGFILDGKKYDAVYSNEYGDDLFFVGYRTEKELFWGVKMSYFYEDSYLLKPEEMTVYVGSESGKVQQAGSPTLLLILLSKPELLDRLPPPEPPKSPDGTTLKQVTSLARAVTFVGMLTALTTMDGHADRTGKGTVVKLIGQPEPGPKENPDDKDVKVGAGDGLARVRFQLQTGHEDITSVKKMNLLSVGVTKRQGYEALMQLYQDAIQIDPGLAKSKDFTSAIVKVSMKIKAVQGGIPPGLYQTTFQETFFYKKKTYRIDVEIQNGINFKS